MENHADPPHVSPSNSSGIVGLIGESAPMRSLWELIGKASQSACPVLLLGETGTGKELVARAIHFAGSHRGKALVTVDCSAITPTLIESELFGHVRGSFTGADRPKVGMLQAANDGTIFLDEIGELPISSQAKLLRALQEKEIRPVGSTERIQISARVIAATNRDLEIGVRAGTFRQDLYFRLNVMQIKLPALREHKRGHPIAGRPFSEQILPPIAAGPCDFRGGFAAIDGLQLAGQYSRIREHYRMCASTKFQRHSAGGRPPRQASRPGGTSRSRKRWTLKL